MKAQTIQALVRGALARRHCALLRVARTGGALAIPTNLSGGALPVITVRAVGALACPTPGSMAAHLALLLRVCWRSSYLSPSPSWYRLAPALLSPLIHLLSPPRAPSPLPDPSPVCSFGLSHSDIQLKSSPGLLRIFGMDSDIQLKSSPGLLRIFGMDWGGSRLVKWSATEAVWQLTSLLALLLGQPCSYHLLPERDKHNALAGPVTHAPHSRGATISP
jgi:hypothetical protein